MKRTNGERRILGMSPFILGLFLLVIFSLSWFLKSSYDQNQILNKKYGAAQYEIGKLFKEKQRIESKLKGLEKSTAAVKLSNSDLSMQLVKLKSAKEQCTNKIEDSEKKLLAATKFTLQIRAHLQMPSSSVREVNDEDYQEMTRKIVKIKDEKHITEQQCKHLNQSFHKLLENDNKQKKNFEELSSKNLQLMENVKGLNDLRSELQNKLDMLQADFDKRGIKQNQQPMGGKNVKMIDHNIIKVKNKNKPGQPTLNTPHKINETVLAGNKVPLTKKPDANKQPGATKQPGVTKTPGATKQPGVTKTPGKTKQPGVTKTPGTTKQPGLKKQPHTNKPGLHYNNKEENEENEDNHQNGRQMKRPPNGNDEEQDDEFENGI